MDKAPDFFAYYEAVNLIRDSDDPVGALLGVINAICFCAIDVDMDKDVFFDSMDSIWQLMEQAIAYEDSKPPQGMN